LIDQNLISARTPLVVGGLVGFAVYHLLVPGGKDGKIYVTVDSREKFSQQERYPKIRIDYQ